jgi:glycosyltransferase involved in cell wall biosynthesis
VLCAGRRQRELLEAEIETVAASRRPPLCTVPFGIDEDAPTGGGNPLRDHFPQIEEGDRVVLWWGSLWRWLDAETAIRAVASLGQTRPELKLVFTAGKAPNGSAERHSALGEARALAADLGVLDRTVLFLDEWVPFAQRGDYIRDADVGLTLHRDSEEASLAARARYMDYLWSGLPCVLGRGDEAAERFEQAGFATLVEAGSPQATAAALLALLEPEALARAGAAGRTLAEEMRWRRVAMPLVEALRELEPGAAPAPAVPQLRYTTSYYARRLGDRLLPSA